MDNKKLFESARPKIGIRVIVDGRYNGVREKIEGPTFALAEKARTLLEENVFYPDGQPVECIIGSTGVGGVREAEQVAQEFRDHHVGAVISISRAFAYAAEIMVWDTRIPQAIWGFSGSERPGSVYLAAAAAVAEQKGYPVFKIYGRHVQDADDLSVPEDVGEKLIRFARCALAVAVMKGRAYLSVGNVCMGIGGSIVDQEFFRCYLGMRTETVDMNELQRRLKYQIYDQEEFETALAWVKDHCPEMEDPNPPEIRQNRSQKDQVWETSVKMTLILRDLMAGNEKLAEMGWKEEAKGHYALAAGFQGQRQWSDFMPNGDFSEAILNSTFDWNGPRKPYVLATENDSLNGVTMLWGSLLTGTAQIFCDVRAYWSPESVASMTEVPLPKEAEGVEGSSIYLRKGDEITVRDLLYGLMLRSGNDAATALAIEAAGSVEKFALIMNETAVSLGAYNSNFVNPHGLHDDNHYTTAYDLALITAAAYENPEFVKIASTLQAKILINDEAHYIANKNKLLKLYDGANGVKTGYTKKSGRCLVGGAQRDGMQLISVVLNYGDMWNDTIRMLNYGFENFEMKPFDKSLLENKTGKQPIEFVRPENEYKDLAEERFPLRKDGSEYLIVKSENKLG